MGNKCMFCIPEEEAKDVGEADICDECAGWGLEKGILTEDKGETRELKVTLSNKRFKENSEDYVYWEEDVKTSIQEIKSRQVSTKDIKLMSTTNDYWIRVSDINKIVGDKLI